MPGNDRKIPICADILQPFGLVVDQCFQWANIDEIEAAPCFRLVAQNLRDKGQECCFSLATRR